ncbi:MAG TPA: HNH endonuclease signature motif containing protein [Cytophagales bacterium]|nr:HNH endonuclease signature motif containing protein [Cytophagales bacterium]
MITKKKSGRVGAFSDITIQYAHARQNGRCGICGQKLDPSQVLSQAHHIRSTLYGGDNSVGNCVILCMERKDGTAGCHLFAHGDYYHRKFELDVSEYKYLNG